MKMQPLQLEGTWEEIVKHSDELAGRRVRLIVLPGEAKQERNIKQHSTARSLLKHAGTWLGNDLEERLREVHDTRSQAKF